jgi:hypothetical protein
MTIFRSATLSIIDESTAFLNVKKYFLLNVMLFVGLKRQYVNHHPDDI